MCCADCSKLPLLIQPGWMRDCHFRGGRRLKAPFLRMNTLPLGHLFLQIAVILITCKFCSLVMRRLGQPSTIGEMIAGVLLGPSLLGALAPEISAWIFPPATKPVMNELAQIGLTLYMLDAVLRVGVRPRGGVRTA